MTDWMTVAKLLPELLPEFVECGCYGEGLHLSADDEVYLSLWTFHRNSKPTWRHRPRYIWRIVTHGDPYGDQIVLSPEAARTTAAALLRMADHAAAVTSEKKR